MILTELMLLSDQLQTYRYESETEPGIFCHAQPAIDADIQVTYAIMALLASFPSI
jgi:hypothetical protein